MRDAFLETSSRTRRAHVSRAIPAVCSPQRAHGWLEPAGHSPGELGGRSLPPRSLVRTLSSRSPVRAPGAAGSQPPARRHDRASSRRRAAGPKGCGFLPPQYPAPSQCTASKIARMLAIFAPARARDRPPGRCLSERMSQQFVVTIRTSNCAGLITELTSPRCHDLLSDAICPFVLLAIIRRSRGTAPSPLRISPLVHLLGVVRPGIRTA